MVVLDHTKVGDLEPTPQANIASSVGPEIRRDFSTLGSAIYVPGHRRVGSGWRNLCDRG